MKQITLGSTGITVPQNAFGALPIQRVNAQAAVSLLLRAYEGGMRFFDTARAYSDSEEKIGQAFSKIRNHLFLATKTGSKTPKDFREHLELSLKMLQTDYIDIYQFHMAEQCYRPGDGTGMYECMLKAKQEGKIRHIGITAHKLAVARECIESGLYETLQYPLSYLSSEKELELVSLCREKNMGFIAMKGLAGGLIHNSEAACAFMSQFDNVVPIWGIQKPEELEEWLSYMETPPKLTKQISDYISGERKELDGDFCRGCGYCLPCPVEIPINNCARMSLMVRRAPSASWLSAEWQANMKKIENCLECGQCKTRCPYQLDIPNLLKKNNMDYQKILSGEIQV